MKKKTHTGLDKLRILSATLLLRSSLAPHKVVPLHETVLPSLNSN